jgi:hypothetical protein
MNKITQFISAIACALICFSATAFADVTSFYTPWYNSSPPQLGEFDTPAFTATNHSSSVPFPGYIPFNSDAFTVTVIDFYSIDTSEHGRLTRILLGMALDSLSNRALYPVLANVELPLDRDILTVTDAFTQVGYEFSSPTIPPDFYDLYFTLSASGTSSLSFFNVSTPIDDGDQHICVLYYYNVYPNYVDIVLDLAFPAGSVIFPTPEPHVYVLIGSMLALAYVLGRKKAKTQC